MKRKNNLIKRSLAIFLVFVMCFGMLQTAAFATDNIEETVSWTETTEYEGSEDEQADAGESEDEQADAGESEDEQTDAGQSEDEQADAGQSEDEQADAGESEDEQTDAGQSEDEQADAGESEDEQADAGESEDEQADAGESEDEQADAGESEDEQADAGQSEDEQADAEQPEDEQAKDEEIQTMIMPIAVMTAVNAVATVNGVSYATLQEAIDAAGAGTTIILLKDVNESIVSAKDFTLDMNGCTICPAGSNKPIFYFSGGNVIIKNGTITGANLTGTRNNVNGTGGNAAIHAAGVNSLKLENCFITGNSARQQTPSTAGLAGAICFNAANASGRLSLIGTVVTGNTVDTGKIAAGKAFTGTNIQGLSGGISVMKGTFTMDGNSAVYGNSSPKAEVSGTQVGADLFIYENTAASAFVPAASAVNVSGGKAKYQWSYVERKKSQLSSNITATYLKQTDGAIECDNEFFHWLTAVPTGEVEKCKGIVENKNTGAQYDTISEAVIEAKTGDILQLNESASHDGPTMEIDKELTLDLCGLTLKNTDSALALFNVGSNGKLTITNGTILAAVSTSDNGELTIAAGAEVGSEAKPIQHNGGTLAFTGTHKDLNVSLGENKFITAGEGFGANSVTVSLDDAVLNGLNSKQGVGRVVTIMTGSVSNDLVSKLTVKGLRGDFIIKLGEFGNIVVEKTEVPEDEAVTKIGETNYRTLEDAIALADNGDIIEIIVEEPVTVSGPIEINKAVTITGGTITRSVSTFSIFKVVGGGKLNLKQITLQGSADKETVSYNDVKNRVSPVVVESGGTLNLDNGATIKGFYSLIGGGVKVAGNMTMNEGASISGNCAYTNDWNSGAAIGGGIYIANGGEVTMNGGSVDHNSALGAEVDFYAGSNAPICYSNFAQGGGIAIASGGAFTMNGGTISYNKVKGYYETAEGGGIAVGGDGDSYHLGLGEVEGNNIHLNAGTISYNEAARGGGIYFHNGTTYFLENVYIKDNKAETGGAVWYCALGAGKFYATSGALFTGNTAILNASDFYSTGTGIYGSKELHLPTRTLSGYALKWYPDNRDARYNPDESEEIPASELNTGLETNNQNNISLHSWTKDSSTDLYELFIVDNEATFEGGGIACNGTLIIGKNSDKTLTVNKEWVAPEGTEIPASIKVNLLRDDTVAVETVELNEANDWSYTWYDLPADYEWTVSEEPVYNWTGSVGEGITTANHVEYTITNTYTPVTSLFVEKVWYDAGYEGNRPDSIEVQLYRNEETYGDPVKLNSGNDWSYEWGQLDALCTWSVGEINVPDGYVSHTKLSEGGARVTITNIHTKDLTVNKVWNDDNSASRPGEVTVQLYCDGEAYGETVTLSKEKGWTYTWTGLEDIYTWSVAEVNVPEGYKADVTSEGTVWTITNTKETPDEPDPGPEPEPQPEPEVPKVEIPDDSVPKDDLPKVDIPEETVEVNEIPLVDAPEESEEEETVEIEDEIPLSDVPRTGDESGFWSILSALSAGGLFCLAAIGRKKREER